MTALAQKRTFLLSCKLAFSDQMRGFWFSWKVRSPRPRSEQHNSTLLSLAKRSGRGHGGNLGGFLIYLAIETCAPKQLFYEAVRRLRKESAISHKRTLGSCR